MRYLAVKSRCLTRARHAGHFITGGIFERVTILSFPARKTDKTMPRAAASIPRQACSASGATIRSKRGSEEPHAGQHLVDLVAGHLATLDQGGRQRGDLAPVR